jgi:ribonuclease HI
MSGRAKLYCDGASSGNPGHAGIGGLLVIGERIIPYSEYIGATTNNVAEYTAFLRGLEIALREGVEALDIYSDSELMVSQIRGSYKVKSTQLKPLYEEALRLLASIKAYRITHVGREANAEADRLAKSAVKRQRHDRSSHPLS